MKALISPNEIRTYDYVDPVQSGQRVAEVTQQPFEVAPPMFWMECADDVVADQFYYDPTDQSIKPVPPEPEPPMTTGTQEL